MCMKNVNLNLVFCDMIPNQDGSDIALANFVGKQFKIQEENGRRVLPQVSLTLFVSATQTKDPDEAARINPDITFSFENDYDIKVRLTETISGSFMDLDSFLLEPAKHSISANLCRKTLNHTRLCVFQNIVLPEEKDNECFVIKALIRRHTQECNNESWAVQAIVPLKIN